MAASYTSHYLTTRRLRLAPMLLLTFITSFAGVQSVCAQPKPPFPIAKAAKAKPPFPIGKAAKAKADTPAQPEERRGTFDAEHGTIFTPLVTRALGLGHPVETTPYEFTNVKYDFVVVEVLAMIMIVFLGVKAGKGLRLRPEGKPTTLANVTEAAADGFRTYLVGVMGEPLTAKYAPLVSSFFFAILIFNYLGMVPFLASPTANPNIPIGLAIVAFFCVHIIAIREAGFKSWFMHFVGEPLWLAPLLFPLHIMGELIKPVSLAIRLLCNIFGDEMIVAQFTLMSIAVAVALHVPAIIPLQLPFLLLGVFFGFVQALVFATLVAIYISLFATHHDDHDEHNIHGHVEETRLHGHHEIIGHPSEVTIAVMQ